MKDYKKDFDNCMRELLQSFRVSLFTFNNKYTAKKDIYISPYG